jgi:CCR4-NOT transcriptional regulation complex NOT5 subunit
LEPFKKSLNIIPLHLGVTTWFVELKGGDFGAISIAQFEKLMKKLFIYEVAWVKMKKKDRFFNFKNVFFYCYFLVVPLAFAFQR